MQHPLQHRNVIRVVCGPMFAGKTTELVRSVREALDSGTYRHVLVIKPESDTRGVGGERTATSATTLTIPLPPPAIITTHDGDTISDCHINPPGACGKIYERVIVSPVASSESIIGVLGECVDDLGSGERVFLGIDEAQFFDPRWVSEVFGWCAGKSCVDFLAVGLDMDRDGNQFPGMGELMRLCQSFGVVPEKLVGVCSVCGERNATHTFFKGKSMSSSGGGRQQVLIGGSDLYEPRCYLHWLTGGVEAVFGR